MPKKKQTTGPKSKHKSPSSLEDVLFALEALHERVAQVKDLKSEGFPYRDALRARAELQMRETIRNVFGERSQEYQRLKNFCIQSTNEGDIAHALIILQDLILIMENRRLNILGIAPVAHTSALNTATKSATDTYQKSSPVPASQSHPSVPIPTHPKQNIQSSPISTASSPQVPETTPARQTVTRPTRVSQNDQSPPGLASGSLKVDRPVTPSSSGIEMNLPRITTSPPATATPSIHSLPSVESAFTRILVIANRFHAVARHLRLRRDYRTTLEVEDQYDVQDLFGSLLKVDFEEVGSEEWMPDYSGFSSQSTFFLAQGQLAIVLKKTRPGWGPRDLHMELAIDIERYATYPECTALFCFVYDPEGRIGNPTSLEEQLTKQDKGLSITTLISPK